ncbi:mammalian cell entry protein [Mycobacterium sp. GA-1999]|nr:mammalian cell entry protein [Mycobacterium sp. GA-0227b]KUH85985.1 mammalian cell entry protein [Mycobacterium sp. GA-1999]KUH87777.1 mammalian cell entry protein [Mycobacterium sp. IS-1556]
MEFDNVLNLPDRAKVVLDGVTVGVVADVKLATDQVDVTSRIDPEVVVPSNIHAALQQATVLGDIYVALERPPTSGSPPPPLAQGGRIPLTQTTSPPQLEDTIASLANFVSSGSIQRIQNTIIRINRLTPPNDEVRRLTGRVVADLSDLSANIDQVDQLLDGVSRTGQVLNDRIPNFQDWVTPKGVRGFERGIWVANQVSKLLPGVGSIYEGGFWLVPLLNSLAESVGAFQRSKWAFEEEIPKWRRLFTDFFLPQDKYPAINITSIVGPDGRELSGNVQDVLRILGAVP